MTKRQFWKVRDENNEEKENPCARKRKNAYGKQEETDAQANSFAKKKKDEKCDSFHENPLQRSGRDAVWMMNRHDENNESRKPLRQAM